MMSPPSPGSNELRHVLEESVARVMRGERDPERMARALEAAKLGREEMRREVGTVDICVDLIRETRDE